LILAQQMPSQSKRSSQQALAKRQVTIMMKIRYINRKMKMQEMSSPPIKKLQFPQEEPKRAAGG
jgi:hypothetical protein